MSATMRPCRTCNVEKPLSEFHAHRDCKSGKSHTCRECKKLYLRAHRKKNSNEITKRYEKTPRGFLMRLYRNMQSRTAGIQKLKAHLYVGKSLLPREEFYEWAMSDPEFERLFRIWECANHDRRLTPTVDRIDSSAGYELANMRWLTHSENSRHVRRREARPSI